MALDLKQTVKLSQQLVMTPQLQQAIKLLQLSRLELVSTIQQELVENPVLEEVEEEASTDGESGDPPEPDVEAEAASDDAAAKAEAGTSDDVSKADAETAADLAQVEAAPEPDSPKAEEPEPSAEDMISDVEWENYLDSAPQTALARPDDRPPIDANLTPSTSLCDHLYWQLGFQDMSDDERDIATLIIGNLNDDGYLDETVEGIAGALDAEPAVVEGVLQRVQRFDPIGVAARSLSECLLIQMDVAGEDDRLARRIVEKHLDLLQRKDYRGITRLEDCTIEDVSAAARIIGAFEPRPGREYSGDDPQYITPDIFVHKLGDEYHVVLNEDEIPRLRVSQTYRGVLGNKGRDNKDTRDYVREKLRSAVWLIKSIHQRQRTIVRVMESLLRFQRDFFDTGPEALRPLNLRDVAEDIGMHESTVSRVTTAKYVQTPHGVFELKYFFTSSIQTRDGDTVASENVKQKILRIIKQEDPTRPYSDQRIAELLKDSNIKIARRTVTKYREAMRILSSTQRREIG